MHAEEPAPEEPSLDTTIPIISAIGELAIDLYVGQEYVELGATASDDMDGDITTAIIADGLVDSSIPGIYSINYNVSDSSLNQATTVSRIVTIKEIPKVNIHLVIEADSGSIYNSDIEVSACTSDGSNTYSFLVYCALSQSGVGLGWSWWGEDAFLNEINGIVNNSNENGIYWGWFSNSELGQVALNKHIMNDGDYIVLNYNINPLRILVDNTNPSIGDSVVFTVESFSYDSFWNPVWIPVEGASVKVGVDTITTDLSGKANYVVNSSGNINASAHKDGFIDSSNVIFNVPAPQGSSGGSVVPEVVSFSKQNAISFLNSNKKPDGSFGSSLYTDWVAVAFRSAEDQTLFSSLGEYLKLNNLNSDLVTDNERRALSLMATGINPYNGTSVNYISKIIQKFDGNQIGDINLDNDDIFGLIVLKKAGYSYSDEIISRTIDFIKSKQLSDGSWDSSPDMTSAAIMSLYPFKNKDGVSDSIDKAYSYLTLGQSSDGSISGNVSSTSWMVQAMSLDPQFSGAMTKARNYIALQQKSDGGIGEIGSDIDSRVWATSYALTAESLKSWIDILPDFDKVNDTESTSKSNQNTPDVFVVEKVPVILETIEIPKVEENTEKIVEIIKNQNQNQDEEIKNIPPAEEVVIEEKKSNLGNSLVASAGQAPIKLKMPLVFKAAWKGIVTFFTFIFSFF
ncbi:MAG: hypothetical protein RL687_299 [Candidatus Parcubacteria bacterium]